MKRLLYLTILALLACNTRLRPPLTTNQKDTTSFSILKLSNGTEDFRPAFCTIFIQEHGGPVEDTVPSGINMHAWFYDKSRKKGLNIPATISVNNILLDDRGYSKFFDTVLPSANPYGKLLPFEIRLTATNQIIRNSLYVPKPIRLDMPSYLPQMANTSSVFAGSSLSIGDTIRWNPDLKNSFGVCISIEYRPTENGNERLSIPYHAGRANYILVPDTGSCTLDSAFFSRIPPNASVTLTLARGARKRIHNPRNETQDFEITATSRQQLLFKYQ